MKERSSWMWGDSLLLISTLILLLVGWLMEYSASTIVVWKSQQDPHLYLKRRLLHILIGLLPLVLTMRINYHKIRRLTYPLLISSLLLLLLVLSPWFGREVSGARRWLNLGLLSFQPAELAKMSLILYLAHSLTKRQDRIQDLSSGYLPNFIILGIFSGLIFLQPDFGTGILLLILGWTICLLAGARLLHLFSSVSLCLPFILGALLTSRFRRERLLTFLDPWSDPLDRGYQITQSFLALGNGGWWGTGLGCGKQKLFYLPEGHTDFIFAIIGEELGFLGALGIVLLLGIIICRGFKIAISCKDCYGSLLASGITAMIAIQSVINLSVVVGLLPIKGLPLPFISWGGSSLLIDMTGIGLLWNISQEIRGC